MDLILHANHRYVCTSRWSWKPCVGSFSFCVFLQTHRARLGDVSALPVGEADRKRRVVLHVVLSVKPCEGWLAWD